MQETGIAKHQIRMIHALRGKLRWTDEEYRAWLGKWYWVESCLDLSYPEAKAAIITLGNLARAAGSSWTQKPQIHGEKKYDYLAPIQRANKKISPKQMRLVEALWADVSRYKTTTERETALKAFLKRQCGTSQLAMVPQSWANRIITALLAMKEGGNGGGERVD